MGDSTDKSSAGADSQKDKASNQGGTSTNDPASGVERCPVCDGLGWVSRELPLDDPEFGQLIPCVCRAEDLKRERFGRLQRYGQLEPYAHITFETH